MDILRKLLFPFSILYGAVTGIRNWLYDRGTLPSKSFDIPVIVVGNLSVGGTGKTPMIEYLIRLLSENHQVATLSRGYKRRSSGFVLADDSSDADVLGDEPMQFHSKFPDVSVAVDVDRANGITRLIDLRAPDVLLLDDAFQHRKVRAGLYVLLTPYGDVYADDYLLPTGNLREPRSGARRADVIVVTKCPETLTKLQMEEIRKKLCAKAPVFFSSVAYANHAISQNGKISVEELIAKPKLVVAGIARPKPFFDFLRSAKDATMQFPDHHDFSEQEILQISKRAKGKPIITTEKDYMRLKGKLPKSQLFYLPIESRIRDSDPFDKIITDYVGKNTTNRGVSGRAL